jgi:hypothetical protein
LVQQDARRTSGFAKTQCVRFCGLLVGREIGHQLNVGELLAGLTAKQSGPFHDRHENGPGSVWYRFVMADHSVRDRGVPDLCVAGESGIITPDIVRNSDAFD